MAVTPMDLQVLFMQEGKAAKQADRLQRFPKEVRNRIGRRTVAESLRESVDETDSAETKVIDEDAGQQTQYFSRRQPRHREPEEDTNNAPDEEGKGAQIDLKV
jgi:hypothetical protein